MRSRDLISIRYVTVWSRDLFSTNQSAVFSSSPQTPGSDCATGNDLATSPQSTGSDWATGSDFATGSGCATGSDFPQSTGSDSPVRRK